MRSAHRPDDKAGPEDRSDRTAFPDQMELEGGILRHLPVDGQSCAHQGRAGIGLLAAIDRIHGSWVKTLGADVLLRTVAGQVRDHHAQEGLVLILGHMLPGGHIPHLEGIRQAVKVPLKGDVLIFPEPVALLLADLLLLFGKVGGIQLIAEGAAHGHHSLRLQRDELSAVGDMSAHGAGGVDEGGPIVELQPVDRMVIIADPVLGIVMEHGRVVPSAAAAAAFEEDIRVGQDDLVHDPVQAQDIAVVDLPLLFGREGIGPDICQGAVDIPLYIVDVGIVQDPIDLFDHIVLDLPAAHVQCDLVAAAHRMPAWDLHGPFRVSAVEVAVLGDHLRLEPDPKLHI